MSEAGRVVSWNITSRCNYACSYCAQGKRHETGPAPGVPGVIADFLSRLGPGWEVKISGGEPFMEPDILPVTARLAKAGLRVSIVTNFSFPEKTYAQFINAAGSRLRTLSLSLHLEYITPERFLQKCLRLQKKLKPFPEARMVVNIVLVPGRAAELLALKETFEARGLSYYPQLQRVKGKPVAYDAAEAAIIDAYRAETGSRKAVNTAPSFKGILCGAGMDYFIISETGDCHTCYPGKRDGSGFMGGIATGDVAFRETALPCPYDVCPCSVPVNRGIVGLH